MAFLPWWTLSLLLPATHGHLRSSTDAKSLTLSSHCPHCFARYDSLYFNPHSAFGTCLANATVEKSWGHSLVSRRLDAHAGRVAVLIHTYDSSKDIWPLVLGAAAHHLPLSTLKWKLYFANEAESISQMAVGLGLEVVDYHTKDNSLKSRPNQHNIVFQMRQGNRSTLYSNLSNPESDGWSLSLLAALEAIPETYVLYLQEDYLFGVSADAEQLAELTEFAEQHRADVVHYCDEIQTGFDGEFISAGATLRFYRKSGVHRNGIGSFGRSTHHFLTHHCGLWRKKYLEDTLKHIREKKKAERRMMKTDSKSRYSSGHAETHLDYETLGYEPRIFRADIGKSGLDGRRCGIPVRNSRECRAARGKALDEHGKFPGPGMSEHFAFSTVPAGIERSPCGNVWGCLDEPVEPSRLGITALRAFRHGGEVLAEVQELYGILSCCFSRSPSSSNHS